VISTMSGPARFASGARSLGFNIMPTPTFRRRELKRLFLGIIGGTEAGKQPEQPRLRRGGSMTTKTNDYFSSVHNLTNTTHP
jgi:hypothetical protein